MDMKNQWVPPSKPHARRPPPQLRARRALSSVRMPVTVLQPPHSKLYPKKMENGGYNYHFVDEEELPEECTCPICRLVQREAHQVMCCGKIYCKRCLDELKSKSDNFNCPNCRRSLEGEHRYFPDINTISKIRHFAIFCDNKDKGCQWEGLLKNFEEGHLPKCPYQIIECRNNCGVTLQRRKLNRHSEECPRRQFICPFCKKWGEYKTLTGDHITTCPDYILECPNSGCDKRIKRCQMTQHRSKCPKEIIPCHHSSIGCNSVIQREELPSHDQECMSSHLDLAIKEIHELRRDKEHMSYDLNLVKQEIHELKRDKEHANQEICKLRTQTFKIPVIKMQNYSRNKRGWISPGFYVSTDSYKMALKVSTYKWWNLEYLSCSLALLPGEYDDMLEWPFQGEVTVELLNQKEDKDHKNKTINFNKDTPEQYKKRVARSKEIGGWWGQQDVIDIYHLDPYLSDNDTLYFRMSVKIHTRSWLV